MQGKNCLKAYFWNFTKLYHSKIARNCRARRKISDLEETNIHILVSLSSVEKNSKKRIFKKESCINKNRQLPNVLLTQTVFDKGHLGRTLIRTDERCAVSKYDVLQNVTGL